ncbi:MAG: glutathione peroxidase [Bacteriovoracaceae bacterium]
MTTIYDFSATLINGQELKFSELEGKVLIIVNTASKCGFTPQYKDLESLYKKYSEKGLMVLGFPCNQFGKQEPGDSTEILNFCQTHYDVTFPVFKKIEVNGDNEHPLFKYLKSNLPGIMGTEAIKWNFTKFLVDNKGKPYKRYAPKDSVNTIEKDLISLLNS